MKGSPFERIIMIVVNNLVHTIYQKCLLDTSSMYIMQELRADGTLFRYFSYSQSVTDVIFQEINRTLRPMDETRDFYSQRQEIFGYKVEFSVLPNGLAIHYTSHARNKTAEIRIFCGNLEFHDSALLKTPEDIIKVDDGVLSAKHRTQHTGLVDIGYQRLGSEVFAVHPFRQPPHGTSSVTERRKNDKSLHNNVIVEYWLCRICTLWTF